MQELIQLGDMNSFFKTNGAQEDMIKDIIRNFENSALEDDSVAEDVGLELLKNNHKILSDSLKKHEIKQR